MSKFFTAYRPHTARRPRTLFKIFTRFLTDRWLYWLTAALLVLLFGIQIAALCL